MILKIENGSFAYKGGPQILKDINAEIEPGEILAVLGPNGAGKTTLLRCMMDMLHWDSGRSLLAGEDIRTMPPAKLWRRMAYVPQARSAAASYTALQTVLLGRSSRIGAFSSPSDEDIKTAERVMADLGISHLADKPCHAISGGELQMVLIARAMAAEPEILVLDEPESNLDFRNQLVVLDAMSELAAKGVACIFNTHYPAHALQRAGKSLLLFKNGSAAVRGADTDAGSGADSGRGCIFGSTPEVVTEENIRKAFGVDALIGEVETPHTVMKNIVPVGIASEADMDVAGTAAGDGSKAAEGIRGSKDKGTCLASISIISDTNDGAGMINSLLSEYSRLLIGRMGLPHRSSGKYIITVMLEGPSADIEALTHRLGLIPGISVKTTYA